MVRLQVVLVEVRLLLLLLMEVEVRAEIGLLLLLLLLVRRGRRGRRRRVLREHVLHAGDVVARRRLQGSSDVRGRRRRRRNGPSLRRPGVRRLLSLRSGRGVVQPVAAVQLRLVLLRPLHPPVLEPDLDLALSQAECVCNLDPAPAGQVAVEVELLLQLQGLVARVRLAAAFPLYNERTYISLRSASSFIRLPN